MALSEQTTQEEVPRRDAPREPNLCARNASEEVRDRRPGTSQEGPTDRSVERAVARRTRTDATDKWGSAAKWEGGWRDQQIEAKPGLCHFCETKQHPISKALRTLSVWKFCVTTENPERPRPPNCSEQAGLDQASVQEGQRKTWWQQSAGAHCVSGNGTIRDNRKKSGTKPAPAGSGPLKREPQTAGGAFECILVTPWIQRDETETSVLYLPPEADSTFRRKRGKGRGAKGGKHKRPARPQ